MYARLAFGHIQTVACCYNSVYRTRETFFFVIKLPCFQRAEQFAFLLAEHQQTVSCLSGLDNGEYTSHWYYSYEATQLLTAATFGMETVEDFIPYTVAHIGDTLFIANTGQAGHSLLVFSQKKSLTVSACA